MSRPNIVVVPGRTVTQYVTREVHEHRAPTDESVKLLREMEQAAEAKRIAGMRLEGNEFHGMVEVNHHCADYRTEAVAIFDLNGKRCTARAQADGLQRIDEALMVKLRDETAKVIAGVMLLEFARRLPK